MTDPDRLAEIKAQLHAYKQAHVGFSELGSFASSADIDWLVGEVERLREENRLLAEGGPAKFAARNAELRDEVERLRGLLARLEWAGGTYCDESCCPECGAIWHDPKEGPIPHDPGCWLADELQRRDPPDSPEHIWIEVSDYGTLPYREWMCNAHPGERRRQEQWRPPPGPADPPDSPPPA
jgi:hypothetical protein